MFYGWYVVAATFAALFALVFGICYGGYVALMPALTADYFAGRDLTGIIGAQYTAVAFGGVAGPVLAGFAYDRLQSYALPILAGAAVCLAGAVLVARMPEPAARH